MSVWKVAEQRNGRFSVTEVDTGIHVAGGLNHCAAHALVATHNQTLEACHARGNESPQALHEAAGPREEQGSSGQDRPSGDRPVIGDWSPVSVYETLIAHGLDKQYSTGLATYLEQMQKLLLSGMSPTPLFAGEPMDILCKKCGQPLHRQTVWACVSCDVKRTNRLQREIARVKEGACIKATTPWGIMDEPEDASLEEMRLVAKDVHANLNKLRDLIRSLPDV